MKVKYSQHHTTRSLEDLDYGSVFEYNEEVYIYVRPENVKPECSDTTPVLSIIGNIYYLSKVTQVIHYPDAELHLGNAYLLSRD
jgi:hypothetical protein